MLLSSSPRHHSAEKFPIAAAGLRSLLLPTASRAGVVVRRALAAASSHGCGGSIIGGDAENAKAEEDVMIEAAEEVEDAGCWVSYGRREPRRRLPPPIPSLLARGALRRTRTDDGRLVLRIAPVVWGECIRAWRRGGRLTMQLVERDDDESSVTLLDPAPRGADVVEALDDDTAAPDMIGEGVVDNDTAAREVLPVVPPPRVPSAGCFEDVFKYSSMGGTSLHQIMPSLRMVH